MSDDVNWPRSSRHVLLSRKHVRISPVFRIRQRYAQGAWSLDTYVVTGQKACRMTNRTTLRYFCDPKKGRVAKPL